MREPFDSLPPNKRPGVQMRIAEEPELLGSAGTLAENSEFIAGEESFFVLYADVLTNVDLRQMFEFHHQKHLAATLGVCQVPDPSRCGIVTMDENEVISDFAEKPTQSCQQLGVRGRDGCRTGVF